MLQCLGPFSGALFGWLILKERVEAKTWAAMAVAVVGVLIMVGDGGAIAANGSVVGLVMALCIPVAMGLYNVKSWTPVGTGRSTPTLADDRDRVGTSLGLAMAG